MRSLSVDTYRNLDGKVPFCAHCSASSSIQMNGTQDGTRFARVKAAAGGVVASTQGKTAFEADNQVHAYKKVRD